MRVYQRLSRPRRALNPRGRRGSGSSPRVEGAAAGLPVFMRTAAPPAAHPEVRDDAEAHEAAVSVGAHAFTRGDQMVHGLFFDEQEEGGFGEDEDAAAAFASRFGDTWTQNAARHGVWQARLAF